MSFSTMEAMSSKLLLIFTIIQNKQNITTLCSLLLEIFCPVTKEAQYHPRIYISEFQAIIFKNKLIGFW